MYQSLNHSRREIRLIDVENGNFDDVITCTVRVVSLDENPAYEALSYVWGDQSLRTPILLQGVLVDVTLSLKVALQYLRRSDTPRTIWADAICINQADLIERASQVKLMGDIYRDAITVVAWLGESSQDSDSAVDSLEAMSSDDQLHWDLTAEPAIDARFLTSDSLRSVAALLGRPWWHRVWTLQESILPRDLVFMCGTRELSAVKLFGAVQNSVKHCSACCYGIFKLENGLVLRTLKESMAMPFMLHQYRESTDDLNIIDLISLYRERQCSDPRDKIYGLLGLAQGLHAALVEPDYLKSTQQVFEEATVQLLQRSTGLQSLSLIMPPATGKAGIPGLPNLPSWVPDWTVEGSHWNYRDLHVRLERLILYSAGGASSEGLQYQFPGRLAFRAVIIGKIERLGMPRDSGEGRANNSIFKTWRHMADVDSDPNRKYPVVNEAGLISVGDSDPVLFSDAYWLTLCGSASIPEGGMTFQAERIRNLESHRKIHNAWWTWTSAHDTDVSKLPGICAEHSVSMNSIGNFLNSVFVTTGMRRFFLTNDDLGLVGLAPSNAEVGDAIALIEGALVPFILRKAASTEPDNCWSFVGDAYVHGVMDGEGMRLGQKRDIIIT